MTSFTGFKLLDYLVTDNVMNVCPEPAEVVIKFTGSDGISATIIKRISWKKFNDCIVPTVKKRDPGYLILKDPFKGFDKIPSLRRSMKFNYDIGHPVAVLGYQLEQDNLSIKNGILSSYFRDLDGINYLQVDCSVKMGNAGGPVLDTETLEVIGIIGHRLAYKSKSYRELNGIINRNLKILKDAEGKLVFDEIDPIQVLMVNQNQIKHLAREFYKSATLRVGYAADLCSFQDLCPDTEDVASFDTEISLDE